MTTVCKENQVRLIVASLDGHVSALVIGCFDLTVNLYPRERTQVADVDEVACNG